MRPSELEAEVIRAIVASVRAPHDLVMIPAWHVFDVAKDPMQLADYEVAAESTVSFGKGRHRLNPVATLEDLTVVFRLPLRVHDQQTTRQEAQQLAERIVACLVRVDSSTGLLRVLEADITPKSSSLKKTGLCVIGTVVFRVMLTWDLSTEV